MGAMWISSPTLSAQRCSLIEQVHHADLEGVAEVVVVVGGDVRVVAVEVAGIVVKQLPPD